MITGPTVGTFRRPVTFGRKRIIRIGERNALSKVYAITVGLNGEAPFLSLMIESLSLATWLNTPKSNFGSPHPNARSMTKLLTSYSVGLTLCEQDPPRQLSPHHFQDLPRRYSPSHVRCASESASSHLRGSDREGSRPHLRLPLQSRQLQDR